MIRILAVGRMRNAALTNLGDDYLRRLRRLGKVEVTELKDTGPQREARAMVAALGSTAGSGQVIALDERGEDVDSAGFARLLGSHGNLAFLIGGPDGLADEARHRADRSLRLSALTFTHEMARVLLLEQIYRGLCILKGHPYHRA